MRRSPHGRASNDRPGKPCHDAARTGSNPGHSGHNNDYNNDCTGNHNDDAGRSDHHGARHHNYHADDNTNRDPGGRIHHEGWTACAGCQRDRINQLLHDGRYSGRCVWESNRVWKWYVH
jgi:hypothetical protein